MFVFIHTEKTLLIKLTDLYPECPVLLTKYPNLNPLNCLTQQICPANSRCIEKLVPRLRFLFDNFKEVEMILAYFRSNVDSKLYAGVFWNDDRELPNVIRIHPKGWEKLKVNLEMYEVNMPTELLKAEAETSILEPDASLVTTIGKKS